jgi:hypothetical protein
MLLLLLTEPQLAASRLVDACAAPVRALLACLAGLWLLLQLP